MSGVTLCMVVRNEATTLPTSLGPLVDAVDAVAVLDDSSRDDTVELLRDTWGITPIAAGPRDGRSIADLRNQVAAGVHTPWLLWLDADEQLDPTHLDGLVRQATAAGDGLFLPWHTHLGGGVIVDYKLVLARSSARHRGLVHETLQPWFREHHWHAELAEDAVLAHHPPRRRRAVKRHWYRRTLHRAIQREPHWLRYHWFLGLLLHDLGDPAAADPWLEAAAAGQPLFPVEQLNAHLLLAGHAAARSDHSACAHWVAAAAALHDRHRDDFEVRANTRLGPWIAAAGAALDADAEAFPAPYAFTG